MTHAPDKDSRPGAVTGLADKVIDGIKALGAKIGAAAAELGQTLAGNAPQPIPVRIRPNRSRHHIRR